MMYTKIVYRYPGFPFMHDLAKIIWFPDDEQFLCTPWKNVFVKFENIFIIRLPWSGKSILNSYLSKESL